MMRTRYVIVALVAVLSTACASREAMRTPASGTEPVVSAAWLETLAAEVGDRRLLQLGESGHGMAETYQVKTDIVRHMHELHGFDILAIEGGLAECWVAAQTLAAASPADSMADCLWGAWASEEAEALFAYLRSRAATDRPLRLVGVDNSPTSRAFSRWLATRPDLPDALLSAELDFLRVFQPGERDETLAVIRARAVENFRRAYVQIDDPMLAMIIEDRLATLDFDPDTFDLEVHERNRERRMAVNLLRHLDRNPGARAIYWAHTAHVARSYSEFVGGIPRQGEFIHGGLGAQSYVVGIYPLAGRGYAWFINQDYDILPPQPGSLEARMAALPGDPVFLDLDQAVASGMRWAAQPVMSYEWGLNEQLIVPREMYDGLLLLREVTPITREAP